MSEYTIQEMLRAYAKGEEETCGGANRIAAADRIDELESVVFVKQTTIEEMEDSELAAQIHAVDLSNGLMEARELLDRAMIGLDWYREAHPEDDSPMDDEFRDEVAAARNRGEK